jgi:hypothetical protein
MYTCRSRGSAFPIRFNTAIAPTYQATETQSPHHDARLNASATLVSKETSTSSRSPPMSWFGRFADWWMMISRGRSAESIVYTTAAVTPNADESIGAANTRTETTSPIMQARRPNSVSSPPQSIVPPAIAIPIRPIA